MATAFAQPSAAVTVVDVPANPSYQSFRQSQKEFILSMQESARYIYLSGERAFLSRNKTRDSSGRWRLVDFFEVLWFGDFGRKKASKVIVSLVESRVARRQATVRLRPSIFVSQFAWRRNQKSDRSAKAPTLRLVTHGVKTNVSTPVPYLRGATHKALPTIFPHL